MDKPNLIVTYDPTHHTRAKAEVEELLSSHRVKFMESGFEGLFLAHVDGDSKEIVKALVQLCVDEPFRFKYTYRWIPVEHWVPLADADAEIAKMNSRIGASESWKLDIGKRGYEGGMTELIERFAKNIDRPKVDLKNAQKIVKIEIVGDHAGVALLDRSELLNVQKAQK